ncbi:MAG: (2Fe-2S)-binding protein [Nitrospinota bacterium]
MIERHEIRLKVNGSEVRATVEPHRTLADFLRENLGLTGTHLGCEHGVCGACTVLLDGATARSCLMFAVQAEGGEVTTVEGLARDGELHLLQESFHERHALQCGFCTPGMLMTACELLDRNREPDEAQVREALAGNLCMCTGYVNIVRAVLEAARKMGKRGVPAQAGSEAAKP